MMDARKSEDQLIQELAEARKRIAELEKYAARMKDQGKLFVQDINEQKRTEQQLIVTLESIGDGFFSCDGDWKFVYVNYKAEKLLKIDRAEVIGKSLWEVFPLTLGTNLEKEYRLAASGEIRDSEDFYEPWGRWFHNRCFPREGGGMSVYFQDITDRKRTEEASRESEAKCHKLSTELEQRDFERSADVVRDRQQLNDVLNMLPAYVVLLTPDYRVPLANRFFEQRFGKSEGRRCYEYLFNRSEPCETCESYTALKRWAPHRWEWTGPDGRIYDIYDFPFTDTDGSKLVMEVGLDITEIKQAQAAVQAERQRLYDVLETLPTMICLLTPDYHISFANRSFRERFGESNDRCCYEHCFGRTQPCEFCETYEVLKTGKPHHWEVSSPDGSIIAAYDFPFRDVDGSPMILEMNIDITAWRRAEAELKKLNETLEQRVAERTVALHESEGRFRLALKNSPVLIAMQDSNLVYRWAYNTWTRQPEEVVGKTDADLFAPEDIPVMLEAKRKVLNTGQEVRHKQWLTSNGKRLFLDCCYEPIKDPSGRIIGIDIAALNLTDQRITEEALRESEEKYRTLFDNLNAAALLIEPVLDNNGRLVDLHYLMANAAAKKHLGKTPNEMVGKLYSEVFAYPVRNPVFDDYEKVLSSGVPYKAEILLPTLNRFYDIAVYRPNPGRLALVLSDITDRKQAEEELRKYREKLEELVQQRTQELEEKNDLLADEVSERIKTENALRVAGEYNRSLIEASLDPLVTIDANGRITDVNEATEKVTGKTRTELIGTDFSDYFTNPGKARAGYKQVFIDGSVRDYPLEILHSDGKITPVLYNASVYRDKVGTVIGVFAAARDISKRKRAEEFLRESEARYRLLADNASDIIFTMDADLRFTYISPSVMRVRGFTVEEAMSQTLSDALTPASLEVAMRIYGEELEIEAREPRELWRLRSLELEETCKDGSTIWTETIFSLLRDENKRFTGLQGITRDISERKQAEAERKKLENQLMQVQKIEAIDRFAGGIAHDMNNILYPIIINTETLLGEESPGTDRYGALEQTLKAAHRQRDLVKQILSFSRLTEQSFSPVNMIPLIEETLDFLRSSLPSTIDIQRCITVQTDIVMGNATQIQQIIMNLVQNAADSMDTHKGVIKVKLEKTFLEPAHDLMELQAGEYLELTVRDNGSGMSQDILDRIFEPFFTTKEVGKGTGMGLAVVYGIVKNHGGIISVESELENGSLFTVHLPVYYGELCIQHPSGEKRASADGKGTILLIDDEEFILSSLQRVLKSSGYRVVAMKDSSKALQVFGRAPDEFDLVITDLTMPGITGIELSAMFQKMRSDIPIILSTGFNDAIDEQRVRSLGIKELLLKPTSVQELKSAVRRVLKN